MQASSSPTESCPLLSYVGGGPKVALAHNDVSYAMVFDQNYLTLPLQQASRLATLRAHTFQDGQPGVSCRRLSIAKGTVYLAL